MRIMPNYRSLLEEYLTHYQQEQKVELIKEGMLTAYIEDQIAAMLSARQTILDELAEKRPETSQLQRELEADQMVREIFLPLI